jgi:hypothetical protein
MKSSNTSKHLYKIIGDLQITLKVTRNPFNLPLDSLFGMAARINKKRSFLFVSKLLGKHLAVNPNVSLLSGAALGILYQEHMGGAVPYPINDIIGAFGEQHNTSDMYNRIKSNPLQISEPTLFIGFAETATALGHSMFDIFSGPTKFLHTTRDMVFGLNSTLSFEEEHSHATAQRCYALDDNFFCGEAPVVLVDDEITTGKTALNIIRDLHNKHPRSRYVVASLLDWRSEKDIQLYRDAEQKLGITITCLSLIQGQITVSGGPIELKRDEAFTSDIAPKIQLESHHIGNYFDLLHFESVNASKDKNDLPYLESTGRFGMVGRDILKLDKQIHACSEYLKSKRKGKRTLCMGTGEFMYIPMRIAAGMGEGVLYQSSTRSPIHPHDGDEYAIHNVYPFECPEDSTIANFFYNVSHDSYDEIFVFLERSTNGERLATYMEALKRTAVPVIHFVHCTTN